jgi:GMP synthase (glutamine-hydrolysing)
VTDETIIISHIDTPDVAWIIEELDARGMPHRIVHTFGGETLPDDPQRVVVLGGPTSVYDELDNPPFVAEMEWIRAAIDAGAPTLGICLGSQILAHVLGGAAVPGTQGLEYGQTQVRRTDVEHPLSDAMDGTFFSFHSDTFEPPPGVDILATSDRYPQAWSLGSALAVQFHPEISPDGIRDLIAREGPKLRAAGLDVDAMLADAEAAAPTSRAAAAALIGGWLDLPPSTHR